MRAMTGFLSERGDLKAWNSVRVLVSNLNWQESRLRWARLESTLRNFLIEKEGEGRRGLRVLRIQSLKVLLLKKSNPKRWELRVAVVSARSEFH
jgi:hypothetical protein